MAFTGTHTVYFNDDDLTEIANGFHRLENSFLRRKPHLEPKVIAAVERRLDVLRAAWALLLEEVPE